MGAQLAALAGFVRVSIPRDQRYGFLMRAENWALHRSATPMIDTYDHMLCILGAFGSSSYNRNQAHFALVSPYIRATLITECNRMSEMKQVAQDQTQSMLS